MSLNLTLFDKAAIQVLWHNHCAYCGRHRSEGRPWEVDHILPTSRGGPDGLANLAHACRRCNRAKKDRTAAEFGYPLVEAWAREIAEVVAEYHRGQSVRVFWMYPEMLAGRQLQGYLAASGLCLAAAGFQAPACPFTTYARTVFPREPWRQRGLVWLMRLEAGLPLEGRARRGL